MVYSEITIIHTMLYPYKILGEHGKCIGTVLYSMVDLSSKLAWVVLLYSWKRHLILAVLGCNLAIDWHLIQAGGKVFTQAYWPTQPAA